MGAKPRRATAGAPVSAEELRQTIVSFVESCSDPVIVEAGEKPIAIQPGRYVVEAGGTGCLLHVWGEEGNLVRRISAVERQERGRLDLQARTFGKGQLTLSLVERAHRGSAFDRDSAPLRFRERFRRLLRREFPDWNIERLSSAADLEHTLSPLYSRAVLAAGHQAWAVIAASDELDAASADRTLTFGLIWLDFLRRRAEHRVFHGLKIFLPWAAARNTAPRLSFLNHHVCQYEVYGFDRRGDLSKLDENDHGNLATELTPCLPAAPAIEPVRTWLRLLAEVPGAGRVSRADGLVSLRVRGIQFALAGRGIMTAGLERQEPVSGQSFARVMQLARELSRFRSAHAADTQNPLYRRHPESWLESSVRSRLHIVDGDLLPNPVYSQVPAVAGDERGIIDLLTCGRQGRLALLELKASEDVHLPLQGLDYWMRVHWHLKRGNFSSRGYFPGVEIRPDPPRLLLVSPAFHFHPSTETILRYFSPRVEVERVGLSAEWRSEIKVVFRRKGAERLA